MGRWVTRVIGVCYRWTSKKRLLRLSFTALCVYSCLVVFIYVYFEKSWAGPFARSRPVIPVNELRQMMREDPIYVAEKEHDRNPVVKPPLSDIYIQDMDTLSFLHMPKRRLHATYTELTSANRDTSYPLAPDFTFHIRYEGRHVVLYEDYGPGCVYRIFLFPVLPTLTDALYKIQAKDMVHLGLEVTVDGKAVHYSLDHFMAGDSWPFLAPLNTQHKTGASGMGSYIPICYQTSLKIAYVHNESLPANLFEATVFCTLQDSHCPVHIYSAVSRQKFSAGTQVESFFPNTHRAGMKYQNRGQTLATHLKYAGLGPCRMEAIRIPRCSDCKINIFSSYKPGVISNFRVRLLDEESHTIREHWMDVLLTIQFDGITPPQVDRVPLGSLFGATASLNEFVGAALGKRSMSCLLPFSFVSLPKSSVTGYLSFPMPFWSNVSITLEPTSFMERELLLCYQIEVIDNYYIPGLTGYFHAQRSHYAEDVTGWRDLLSLKKSWGHVVAVLMEIDNLRAVRDAPLNERWAALQSDVVVFLDGSKSASMLGTGLEDYFSYSHGFVTAENTSYAFVGVHHASPRRSEPLTWHCYRLHILDPIPFHNSIQMILDGTSPRTFQEPVDPISYASHMRRKQKEQTAFSNTVLYYAKSTPGLKTADVLHIGDPESEKRHNFTLVRSSSSKVKDDVISLAKVRYLGASNINKTFRRTGRAFGNGDVISFFLNITVPNRGVLLRRDFHSIPMSDWIEEATVKVNGYNFGTWFIPMGTLSEEYSLRQDDLLIGQHITGHTLSLTVTLDIQTVWRDVSYTALVIF